MIQLPHDHGTNTAVLIENAPEHRTFETVSGIFQLISDPTRLKILWLLCHSEDCVANIAAAIDMSSPAVSHHLRVLKQADLLVSHREGKETHYTLASNPTAQLVHNIIDDAFDMNCRK
jgi:DNA-binding transcriptional ArsR family regulator